MPCSSCQKRKENELVNRPRVNNNQSNSNPVQLNNKKIASQKFQTPKVLPPLK